MKMNLVQRWSLGVAVIGTIGVGSICSAQAFNLYTMTDLGTLGGDFSEANDINEVGQIVGRSNTTDGKQRGFVWQNGTMTDLGDLGTGYSDAYKINESGQIVGSSYDIIGDRGDRGFLWQNGTMTDLRTLGGQESNPTDINESGQIVGSSRTADGNYHAFLWENGTITDLNTLSDDINFSYPSGINNAGQITVNTYESGYQRRRSFLWQNGTRTYLSSLGDNSTQISDINESGQIIGGSNVNGSNRAFLWQNGESIYLGSVGGDSGVSDINDAGQIIGTSRTTDRQTVFLWQNGTMIDLLALRGIYGEAKQINEAGQVLGNYGIEMLDSKPFLWEKGKAVDLQNLIDPNSGWDYLSATKINNKGQIIGSGYFNGESRAFLMNPTDIIIDPEAIPEPIPEPSSIIGSILGIGTLVTTARRRQKSKVKPLPKVRN
ncbi:HAF repeat-containing PEP-CTERM protein [Merismopedia glauca]|uniref:HAF repeat-containing protein n=1 Tax=Merismopedia glauca CCAP 1448/3 TaxID=1296344 RepID=A0A2T1C5N2_9CYAN|nr:HAF repeat-containing PEP-CTERM protein [Merismopedia glauca]PSB03556.1 HAF repeat-containing protein [Merismopedia glauca CCAP 1448/3]